MCVYKIGQVPLCLFGYPLDFHTQKNENEFGSHTGVLTFHDNFINCVDPKWVGDNKEVYEKVRRHNQWYNHLQTQSQSMVQSLANIITINGTITAGADFFYERFFTPGGGPTITNQESAVAVYCRYHVLSLCLSHVLSLSCFVVLSLCRNHVLSLCHYHVVWLCRSAHKRDRRHSFGFSYDC